MAEDELQLIDWLQSQQSGHANVELGIGDDMAVLRKGIDRVLISADMLLDGVHFDTGKHENHAIGRKAIACSLSDCAAMAVRPVAAVISLALPEAFSIAQARDVLRGSLAMASDFETAVVGGDTTKWPHPLAIDVSIAATPYPGHEPVRRSGANSGDLLYVTGSLGGSILGRHMTFTPRVREARAIVESLGPRLHAMIDISDGLSLDLWRMCRSSEVGATIDESDLLNVVSEAARELGKADASDPLDHALADGEDYELLLAVDGDADVAGVDLHCIGRVTESGLMIRRRDGRVSRLEPRGFVH